MEGKLQIRIAQARNLRQTSTCIHVSKCTYFLRVCHFFTVHFKVKTQLRLRITKDGQAHVYTLYTEILFCLFEILPMKVKF